VAILDQITKCYIVSLWPSGQGQLVVIPHVFHLVHFRNTGAAWGIFADHPRLLTALSVLVLFVLIWNLQHLVHDRWERALAVGLIMGGIAGNLVDRVFRGAVVDFLFLFYKSFRWPAFNIADSGISCGVCLFLLSSILFPIPDQPADHELSPPNA